MADITIEQLQEVLGGSMTSLSDRLESQQKSQSTSLATILRQVVGQGKADIERYEKTLTDKFNEVSNYIKDLTKEISKKQNQSAAAIPQNSSQPEDDNKQVVDDKTGLFNSIKSVTLNTPVNSSTRAIPVRVIEALNLKKVKEIDTKHKSEVNIDIPAETRVWLENLMFDNFKRFTDDMFERDGGLSDIFGAVHDIDKLLTSGKFGSNKKDDDDWLSKLLKFLGPLLGLGPLLAGLTALLAGILAPAGMAAGLLAQKGRASKRLKNRRNKTTGEEPVEEEPLEEEPKTQTEEALEKAKEKIAQKELEFDKRNSKVNGQIEQLNEDLLTKRQERARVEQAKNDMLQESVKAEDTRQKAIAEAEEKSIKAKESKAESDIKAAEDAKIAANDAAAKATEANVKLQESYSKLDAATNERIEIERKINNLEAEQLKAIDEHNAEIKNIKEGKPTEPLGDKTKAALPEKAAKAADVGKSVESAASDTKAAAEAAKAAAKATGKLSAAAEGVGGAISKWGGRAGIVGVGVSAAVEGVQGYNEYQDVKKEEKEGKITADQARTKKADVVGGRTAEFAARTGTAFAAGAAGAELGAALGLATGPAAVVVSPLLALGLGAAGAFYGDKAFKAAGLDKISKQLGMKVAEGISDANKKSEEDKNTRNVQSSDNTLKPSSPITPVEQPSQITPVEPADQYKKVFTNPPVDTTADGISDLNDYMGEHSNLLKGLIEYQKQTAANTKALINTITKMQNGGNTVSVNNVSSPTSFIQSPVTSSSFRQAILQR